VKALVFDRFGPPEVLHLAELPAPTLSPGHALVRMRAVGLNFADVYRRKGTYHLQGAPPYVLGYEGAGVVEAVWGDGGGFSVGDRVGFADVPHANAELVLAPLTHLVPLPAGISFEIAAGSLLQGLTAQYLVRDSHPLKAGETVVVHAAAGGVGLLLTQIAKRMGARVLGVVSSTEKAEVALSAGCDAVALASEDWVQAAHGLAKGGVDVAFDSVGSTLRDSLRAVRRGGQVVFYGMAGGDPAPVDPRLLMDESKTLTGGDLWNVLTSAEERRRRAAELFGWIESGAVKVRLFATYPLHRGAEAHACLEGRGTVGKLLLIP